MGKRLNTKPLALYARETLAPRFWPKVRTTDTCWVWEGAVSSKGYGVFAVRTARPAVLKGAHRVAYYLATGVDPGALMVCHSCDNPPCVNPEHLFLGTNQDNMRDCAQKGRITRANRLLTDEQVEVIRATYASFRGRAPLGMKQQLMSQFGVGRSCLQRLAAGVTYVKRTPISELSTARSFTSLVEAAANVIDEVTV